MTVAAPPDISAVIVNYQSGRYLDGLIRSLRAQCFRGCEGSAGRLQIIVVDNASPDDQSPFLDPLSELGVDVLRLEQNRGYSGGVNAGVARAAGHCVLVLNPDVLVGPGAVEALLGRLRERPRTGLVGPRGYLDGACYWLLPALVLPTLAGFVAEALGRLDPRFAGALARRRTRQAAVFWSSPEPFRWSVASGYGFMMRGDLARGLGPFDERYPLYYEDGDLCRRVQRSGHDVEIVPAARMIHFYNRSAGQDEPAALAKHDTSARIYYRKFYGLPGEMLYERLSRFVAGRAARHPWRPSHAVQALGDLDRPPILDVPKGCGRWLAEMSVDPCFFWAAGHPGEGERLEMPERTWQCLDPISLYVRFVDPTTFSTIAVYSFRKTVPAVPTGPEEWIHPGDE